MNKSPNRNSQKIFLISMSLLTILLAGCNNQPPNLRIQNNPEESQKNTDVSDKDMDIPTSSIQNSHEVVDRLSYALPAGWHRGSHDLYDVPTVNDRNKSAEIEFESVRDGTDADAEQFIKDYYYECLPPQCDNSEMHSAFKTLKFGIINVYVNQSSALASPDTFQDPESNLGSTFAFSKNGKVFEFVIYGYQIEAYEDAIKQLVETIKIVDPQITYDLPEGWNWVTKPEGLAAIWNHPSKTSNEKSVKFEPTFKPRNAADTKNDIDEFYHGAEIECRYGPPECMRDAPKYKYQEIQIAGTTVYLVMDFRENDANPSWTTYLAFNKDGYEVFAVLYDRADLYIPELTKIISTLKITDSEPSATPEEDESSSRKPAFTYELPDGWEWLDKPEDLVAIWNHKTKVGDSSFVKLEPSFNPGTEEEAKAYINKLYNRWKDECTYAGKDCLAMPEYKEMKIADSKIYMVMDKTEVESPTGSYWETILGFSKYGYLVTARLGDRADLNIPELTKIISTLKITDSETSPAPSEPVSSYKKPSFTYELPDGWEWLDTPEDLDSIWWHNSKVGENAQVKFEPSFKVGTDADAKKEINALYTQGKQACALISEECLANLDYKEIKIADTTVYMVMAKTTAEASEPYWSTSFAFYKDGYEISGILYDRGDLYIPEFTKIISTLKINK